MSDSTDTTTTRSTVPASTEPLKPRAGTIVWGSILLVVAVVTIVASQLDLGGATPEAVVWSVVAFGAVLVLAGIVTAIVRATRSGRTEN